MTKLSELKNDGFQGIDEDLYISLFEYGIIWKKENEIYYTFIYGTNYNEDCEFEEFERSRMNRKEFAEIVLCDWFDIKDILEYTGIKNKKTFIDNFPYSMAECIRYYNVSDMFGENYTKTEIIENDNN